MTIRTLCQVRLKWCGNVFRMSDERITKETMTFDKAPSWKRSPGGIRTTWWSTVAGDLEPVLKPPLTPEMNCALTPGRKHGKQLWQM